MGQTAPALAAGAGGTHPIPLHHKYRYFLTYQMKLDQKADALEQQGYPDKAAAIRNHLQKDLSFTDGQIAILRAAGLQLKSDLDSIQAQANPIISQDRQWRKQYGRSAGPPPGAEQIHELQAQEETVMKDAVTHLNQQLGAAPAARLQSYVATHVVGHAAQFPAHRPKIGTPFHMEGQQ
ncbi:MAG: hypothetical protein ACRD3S_16310 [Terracidiphilus sp.]